VAEASLKSQEFHPIGGVCAKCKKDIDFLLVRFSYSIVSNKKERESFVY